jgi:hypothetical protein
MIEDEDTVDPSTLRGACGRERCSSGRLERREGDTDLHAGNDQFGL